MNLDLFNNLFKDENSVVKNFIKELSNNFENSKKDLPSKNNRNITSSSLKQEDCLYQVVEMDIDGAYLQNTNNNRVAKETDISKDVLDKIGNDSILKYKDGKYVYEEELTRQIL